MNTFLENSLDLPLGEVLEIIQNRIMTQSHYFGIQTHKNPMDMWVYQEIIIEVKPTVIIEIGNKFGGSTLAFAHLLDNLNRGRIIAIDIDQSRVHKCARSHPRIDWIEQPAVAAYEQAKSLINEDDIVLVIEDSSHTYKHTLDVLKHYSPLVSNGSYFIVEDSICHHGLSVGPNPGPYEAINTFCGESSHFEIDRSRESFLITWNPTGFLKRIN